MVSLKNYMTEITLTIITFIWLWFVLTNAAPNLATAYLFAGAISLFLLLINVLIFDRSVEVTFQKQRGKWVEAVIAGAVGWVLVLLVSFFIFKFADPTKASLGSILSSLGAANPAFANSKLVNLITISFAIGYFETQLFARILEFISDRFGISVTKANISNIKFIVLVILLSILFAVFHITSKGISATASLLVVAIMMGISLMMVAYYNGETRQAVITHVLSNFIASYLILSQGGSLF